MRASNVCMLSVSILSPFQTYAHKNNAKSRHIAVFKLIFARYDVSQPKHMVTLTDQNNSKFCCFLSASRQLEAKLWIDWEFETN